MGRGDENEGSKAWKYVVADLARWFRLLGILAVVGGALVTYRDLPKLLEVERRERIEADGKLITEIAKLRDRADAHAIESARYVERFSICCSRREGRGSP